MSHLQPAPPETPDTTLRRNTLGVAGIVFFVVAAAAPLVGMTASPCCSSASATRP